MDDLISRQAAIDAMAELQGRASTKAELKGISKAWKRIKQMPSAQPTVDAVPVVRCKDCKYYRDGDCWHERENDRWIYYQSVINEPTPDDYCSLAERKKE